MSWLIREKMKKNQENGEKQRKMEKNREKLGRQKRKFLYTVEK